MIPRRGQLEQHLERELSDVEVEEVGSIDELTDAHIAVLAELRRRNRIAAMHYAEGVVPTAHRHSVMQLIDEDLVRIAVERRPPEPLPNENLFEHHLGRPLRPIERVRVASFEKMSSEQLTLARTLARANKAAGFLYLSRIAPDESTEERAELAKHLAE